MHLLYNTMHLGENLSGTKNKVKIQWMKLDNSEDSKIQGTTLITVKITFLIKNNN